MSAKKNIEPRLTDLIFPKASSGLLCRDQCPIIIDAINRKFHLISKKMQFRILKILHQDLLEPENPFSQGYRAFLEKAFSELTLDHVFPENVLLFNAVNFQLTLPVDSYLLETHPETSSTQSSSYPLNPPESPQLVGAGSIKPLVLYSYLMTEPPSPEDPLLVRISHTLKQGDLDDKIVTNLDPDIWKLF